MINAGRCLGESDNETSIISSKQAEETYRSKFLNLTNRKQSEKRGWHSDITLTQTASLVARIRIPKTWKNRRPAGKGYENVHTVADTQSSKSRSIHL